MSVPLGRNARDRADKRPPQRCRGLMRKLLLLGLAWVLGGCVASVPGQPVATSTAGEAKASGAVAAASPAPEPIGGLLRAVFPGGFSARTVALPSGARRGMTPRRFRFISGRSAGLVEGSLTFVLKRLKNSSRNDFDTLFSLVDGQGRQILTAYVTSHPTYPSVGTAVEGITLYSDFMPTSVWGFWIPFPQEIPVGQEYQLKLAWTRDSTNLFLNGAPLTKRYLDFGETRELRAGGENFSNYLASARILQIGCDPFPGDNSPLDQNELLSFEADKR